jgi:hypothetical protein
MWVVLLAAAIGDVCSDSFSCNSTCDACDISAVADFGYWFKNVNDPIDISGWNLTGATGMMFAGSNATVNLTGTTITNCNNMFEHFNGYVVGVPNSVSGTRMFARATSIEAVMSNWNIDDTTSFFESASGRVVLDKTVGNGYRMFKNFGGAVTIIKQSRPPKIDNAVEMFAKSTAFVDLGGTTIDNATGMFDNFNGTWAGTPTVVAGKAMFAGMSAVDVSGWTITNATEMFSGLADATINVNNTKIMYGDDMFLNCQLSNTFVGTPIFDSNTTVFTDRVTVSSSVSASSSSGGFPFPLTTSITRNENNTSDTVSSSVSASSTTSSGIAPPSPGPLTTSIARNEDSTPDTVSTSVSASSTTSSGIAPPSPQGSASSSGLSDTDTALIIGGALLLVLFGITWYVCKGNSYTKLT